MTINAIILNYKNKDSTLECVESLKKSQLSADIKLNILVVDNASGDGIERALSSQHTDVDFFQTGANLGYTGGNNAGIREIQKKFADQKNQKQNYILILNNDTNVKANMLQELVNGFSKHPNAGIVSPKIYFDKKSLPDKVYNREQKELDLDSLENDNNVIWFAGGLFDWSNIIGSSRGVDQIDQGQYDIEEEIEVTTGCCMLMPLNLIYNINGFDDKYFMYYEDIDLSLRIKQKGFQIWYMPKAIIWHSNAKSSGLGSPLQDYYITRNRLLLGFKYAPLRTKLALVREALTFYKDKSRPARWQGVKDFFTLKFGKGTFQN